MKPPIDRKAILDMVLRNVPKISEAPQSIPEQVTEFGDPEAWLTNESARRYKALDSGGNVVLISNPIAWASRTIRGGLYDGRTVRVRPKPKFVYSYYAQAETAAKNGDKWEQSAGRDEL